MKELEFRAAEHEIVFLRERDGRLEALGRHPGEGIQRADVEAELGCARATEVGTQPLLVTMELDVILLNHEFGLRLHPVAQSARVVRVIVREDHVANGSRAHLTQQLVVFLRAHRGRGVDHHVTVVGANEKRIAESERQVNSVVNLPGSGLPVSQPRVIVERQGRDLAAHRRGNQCPSNEE